MRPWLKVALLSASTVTVAVAIYAVVVLVVVEVTMGDLFRDEEIHTQAFVSEGWQRPGASYDGTRQAMVQDLLATRTLMGMSEDSVLNLLGKPNTGPWQSASTINYRLGPEPGPFSVGSEWLILELDGGHLSNFSISRD